VQSICRENEKKIGGFTRFSLPPFFFGYRSKRLQKEHEIKNAAEGGEQGLLLLLPRLLLLLLL
jgi:hypothetical protein